MISIDGKITSIPSSDIRDREVTPDFNILNDFINISFACLFGNVL